MEVRSIILHINNKICFSKIRLSSKTLPLPFSPNYAIIGSKASGDGAGAGRRPSDGRRSARVARTIHRAASTACASMCSLANRPATSRAELADSSALSFGCRAGASHKLCEYAPSGKLAASTAWGAGRFRCSSNRVSRVSQKFPQAYAFAPCNCGRQSLCEHVPSGKLTASAAWGAGRFRVPINRVSRAGKHKLCEHAPSGKLTFSFVCRAKSFRSPINRV